MIRQRYYSERLELFNHMIDSKNLLQKLISLDKKTEELDEILKDVRIETQNVLWELVEFNIKKNKTNKIPLRSLTIACGNKNTGRC